MRLVDDVNEEHHPVAKSKEGWISPKEVRLVRRPRQKSRAVGSADSGTVCNRSKPHVAALNVKHSTQHPLHHADGVGSSQPGVIASAGELSCPVREEATSQQE